jgi:hypothetical protein
VDGHHGAGDAGQIAQLLQGGIGLLVDQFAQLLERFALEGGGMTASMGLGFYGTRFAIQNQQIGHGLTTDPEAGGNLKLIALPAVVRVNDALTQIVRKWFWHTEYIGMLKIKLKLL